MFCILQNTLQESGLSTTKDPGATESNLRYQFYELYHSLLHMHVCQVAALSVVFFSSPCRGNLMRSGCGPDPGAAGVSDYWHWVLVWRSQQPRGHPCALTVRLTDVIFLFFFSFFSIKVHTVVTSHDAHINTNMKSHKTFKIWKFLYIPSKETQGLRQVGTHWLKGGPESITLGHLGQFH